MKSTVRALLTGAALILSAQASAQTIIDTGAGENPYSGGYSVAENQYLAGRFTLTQAMTVQTIEGWLGGNSATVFFAGIASDAGIGPGATLFSAGFNGGTPGWQGLSGLNWALGPGTYWAMFGTTSGVGFMPSGVANPLQAYAFRAPPGPWGNAGSLNIGIRMAGITAGAVPEPASWAMIIGGFGLAGAAVRRRRISIGYAAA